MRCLNETERHPAIHMTAGLLPHGEVAVPRGKTTYRYYRMAHGRLPSLETKADVGPIEHLHLIPASPRVREGTNGPHGPHGRYHKTWSTRLHQTYTTRPPPQKWQTSFGLSVLSFHCRA